MGFKDVGNQGLVEFARPEKAQQGGDGVQKRQCVREGEKHPVKEKERGSR